MLFFVDPGKAAGICAADNAVNIVSVRALCEKDLEGENTCGIINESRLVNYLFEYVSNPGYQEHLAIIEQPFAMSRSKGFATSCKTVGAYEQVFRGLGIDILEVQPASWLGWMKKEIESGLTQKIRKHDWDGDNKYIFMRIWLKQNHVFDKDVLLHDDPFDTNDVIAAMCLSQWFKLKFMPDLRKAHEGKTGRSKLFLWEENLIEAVKA